MDVYGMVNDRIIAALEGGTIPWLKPWHGVQGGARSHETGKPYSLLNQILLGKPGEYLTFKQCQREGGKVRKGAKAKIVVFWRMTVRKTTDENGETKEQSIPVLRYFNVFHIDDCEGIEPKHSNLTPREVATTDAAVEQIVNDYAGRAKLTIENILQDEAYYSPVSHVVSLPLVEQFDDAASYYDTAFHELVHSTGHKSLLNRFNDGAKIAAFGSEDYSKEELVAEIGACSIMDALGLETKATFRNNVAYIQSWIRALKNDKRLLVSAASRADKAVRLILSEVEGLENG